MPFRILSIACFIAGSVLFTCTSKPTTGYKDIKTVQLDSVGLTMTVPTTFRVFSILEEMDYWDNSGEPEEVIGNQVAYLQRLLNSSTATQYLADTLNMINNVRIIESPFPIKVGKYFSQKGFLAIDATVQEQAERLDIKYDAVENTYFSLANGNDIMKIRYRATRLNVQTAGFFPNEETTYYATFYVVTNGYTVTIFVNHESEDFEYFVRTIKFH